MFCRLLLVTGWHFCVTVAFASRRRKSWRKQNEKKKNGFNNGMIIKICTINNKTFNQKLKEEKKKNPRHVAHAFIVGLRWHFQRCVCTIKKEKFIDSIRFIYGLEFLFLFFIPLRKWWNVKCIVVLKLQSHEKNVKRSLMDRLIHDLMVKKKQNQTQKSFKSSWGQGFDNDTIAERSNISNEDQKPVLPIALCSAVSRKMISFVHIVSTYRFGKCISTMFGTLCNNVSQY